MNRRIKKKKGLIKTPTSRMIRERIKRELETEAYFLEKKACESELPWMEEKDFDLKRHDHGEA